MTPPKPDKPERCPTCGSPDADYSDCQRCGHIDHPKGPCLYEHWGSDNMDIDVCEVDECVNRPDCPDKWHDKARDDEA